MLRHLEVRGGRLLGVVPEGEQFRISGDAVELDASLTQLAEPAS
jgi:hypothetical protein